MRKIILAFFYVLMYTLSVFAQNSIEIPANTQQWMDTELSRAKRKTLLTKKQFFTKDTTKIVGYIQGYASNLGFTTVLVESNNDLTDESRPIVSEIDSMGKFICIIPMNHPKKLSISIGEVFMFLYLEPGQTLVISFNWDDFERTDGFRDIEDTSNMLLFKGPLAKMNYDILSFPLKTMGYRHYRIMETHSPQDYIAAMDSINTENDVHIKQALKDGIISKEVIEIQKNEALINNGFYLIDYALVKKDEGIQMPANFYNMLQLLPLNDPTSIISDYGSFINRFEFNPVMIKGYDSKPVAIVKQTWASEHGLRVWGKKDSLLKSDMKLSSSFAYEAIKVRSLSRDIQNMSKNEAFAYYGELCNGIKNSHLRQEGLRVLRSQFGMEELIKSDAVNGPNIISSATAKWEPHNLPEGKDTDIFNKIIAPYKGKYLFVDFWGTSCGPCRWGINDKREIRKKNKSNGIFEFVFISCNEWSPNKESYEKYVKEQDLEHSHFVTNDEFQYMMQLFRFTGVPHYLFIDPEGKVLDTNFEMYLGFDEALKWIQTNQAPCP